MGNDHAQGEVFDVGSTYQNRQVKGIRISGTPGAKRPAVVMVCGVHAREWASPATCVYFIDYLLTSYGQDADATKLVDTFEWHIMPVINADGYVYTWSDPNNPNVRFWRKTRTPNQGSQCVGVDPNRNWDFDFGNFGSSPDPCSDIYCGPSAFSEPCMKNLADYIQALHNGGTTIESYIDLHAYSQFWMQPWSYSKQTAPHSTQQTKCGKAVADAFYAVDQKYYKTGPISTTIYQVSGSSVDWTYGKLGIKYSYAAELRDQGQYGFLMPTSEIVPQGKEFVAGMKAMAECIMAEEGIQTPTMGEPTTESPFMTGATAASATMLTLAAVILAVQV